MVMSLLESLYDQNAQSVVNAPPPYSLWLFLVWLLRSCLLSTIFYIFALSHSRYLPLLPAVAEEGRSVKKPGTFL